MSMKVGGTFTGIIIGVIAGGPIGAIVGGLIGLGAGGLIDVSDSNPGNGSESGGHGGISTPAKYDSEGRLEPYGGKTSEGYSIWGSRNSEGREVSVDYVNSEGYRTSSDSLNGNDDD